MTMSNTRNYPAIKKFKAELPFLIAGHIPYPPNLSINGITATGKNFSLVLDFNWEVFVDNKVFSWDGQEESIELCLQKLAGEKIVDIIGPDNLFDATYILESGGMIRSVTSSDDFGSSWALRVGNNNLGVVAGRIDPALAIEEKTKFSEWDSNFQRYTPIQLGLPSQLLGASVVSLDFEKGDHHQILKIGITLDNSMIFYLRFCDSWALYTHDKLLVAGDLDEDLEYFAQIADKQTFQSFMGSAAFGLYGCSLVFDSMRLRQIGSSEPAWSWKIYNEQDELLWRAPTDSEASHGHIDGVGAVIS